MLLNIAGGFQMVCCTMSGYVYTPPILLFLTAPNSTNDPSRRPPCAIVENVRVRDINGV